MSVYAPIIGVIKRQRQIEAAEVGEVGDVFCLAVTLCREVAGAVGVVRTPLSYVIERAIDGQTLFVVMKSGFIRYRRYV